jgi:hypothetical protein
MTDNPYSSYPEEHAPDEIGFERPQSNPLGVVGFVLALLGPLAPIGFIVSAIAMAREPKGFAIAGLIVGVIMTIIAAGCGYGLWWMYDMGAKPVLETQAEYQAISAALNRQGAGSPDDPADLASLGLSSDELTDYWGNPYQLEYATDGSWQLRVIGPDGQPDSPDDAVIPAGVAPENLSPYLQRTLEAHIQQAMGVPSPTPAPAPQQPTPNQP